MVSAALLLALGGVGCKADQQVFYVKGVVKELKPDGKTAVIEHEEIPNYMPKMTMPFGVRDAKELAGLKTNDMVHFRMLVTKDDAWIDQVTKVGVATPTNRLDFGRQFRIVREVEPLKVSDAMPNYTFTNELGRVVSLADFKGQVYAFSFIFTRCPFPLFCPRINENLSAAAKQLSAQKNAPTNWHLFSITFDVEHDTPAVLRNYAQQRYHYDPARWSFLTGALIDIDAITEQFGLVFPRDENGVTFTHNLRTVVVDAAGKVQHVFIGNEWKADELVTELVKGAVAP